MTLRLLLTALVLASIPAAANEPAPYDVVLSPTMAAPPMKLGRLSLAVMFAAPLGGEAVLFRLAAQLEEARPWRERRPPL